METRGVGHLRSSSERRRTQADPAGKLSNDVNERNDRDDASPSKLSWDPWGHPRSQERVAWRAWTCCSAEAGVANHRSAMLIKGTRGVARHQAVSKHSRKNLSERILRLELADAGG